MEHGSRGTYLTLSRTIAAGPRRKPEPCSGNWHQLCTTVVPEHCRTRPPAAVHTYKTKGGVGGRRFLSKVCPVSGSWGLPGSKTQKAASHPSTRVSVQIPIPFLSALLGPKAVLWMGLGLQALSPWSEHLWGPSHHCLAAASSLSRAWGMLPGHWQPVMQGALSAQPWHPRLLVSPGQVNISCPHICV